MKRLTTMIFALLVVGMISMSECTISANAQGNSQSNVTLSPGQSIQAAVDAAPAGTTFTLTAGVYRMQSVQPRDGDIFVGQGNVVLNGSKVLSFQADPAGSGLWVANATADNFNPGTCQAAYPLCGYIQDLFIGNALQTPVSNSSEMKLGTWYFDRANNLVYVCVNPTGHIVELGMQRDAFHGNATGMHISNVTIEKYAVPAQRGAIGGISSNIGTGWVVNHVEVRWNHGRGISLGSGSQVTNCFIHHNGQLGISLYGTNARAVSNEISWNNYANFLTGWEAGGSKFWETTNLVVKSNYVHDNNGPGLWTDFNNVGTLYDSNMVINNLDEGIKHEISYNAIIRYNTVKGNGNTATVWLWNAQIEVQNSSNVLIYGNTVEVPTGGGNGIVLINQNRGAGILGPWVAANNKVHGNTITHRGTNGKSGIVDDTGGNAAVGNQFDFDKYTIQGTGMFWNWFSGMSWTEFQQAGQEENGRCCI